MRGSMGGAARRIGDRLRAALILVRSAASEDPMRHLRRATLRRLRILFLIALTFVPVAASSHFHPATQHHTPDSCAACAVKHHAAGASLSLRPVTAPLRTSAAVVVSIAAAPAHVSRPFRIGRAPPGLFATPSV